jgi:outer membrane protein assembly factor BamE (lipoprotein component of BamABCDE complex)
MQKRYYVAWLILFLFVCGCNTYEKNSGKYWDLRNQRYFYEEVKSRLDQLHKGMTKMDVAVTVGSPAKTYENMWIYLPDRPAIYVPGEAIVIEFEGNLYIRHRKTLVLLGETI